MRSEHKNRRNPPLMVLISLLAPFLFPNICCASGGANIDDAVTATYSRLKLRFSILNSELDQIPANQRPTTLQSEYSRLKANFDEIESDIQNKNGDVFGELSKMEDRLPEYELNIYSLITKIWPDKAAQRRHERGIGGYNHNSDGGSDDFVLFHNQKNRLAVFTFDDPDSTGLGDAISFLLAKKLLYSAQVPSFAVVNYSQGTARDDSGAYFDKVDLITADQGFLFALWGRISMTDGGIQIDSFMQAQTHDQGLPYARTVSLPRAMGGGNLIARLNPNRIQLQSFVISDEDARGIQQAAANLAILRARPDLKSRTVARMAKDQQYTLVEKQGQWVRVETSNGLSGWTSVDQFCVEKCAQLLQAAVLADDLVAQMSGRERVPVSDALSRDAHVFSDQLTAILALQTDPKKAASIVDGSTITPPGAEGISGEKALPPWAAGNANLLAVAQVSSALQEARRGQPNLEAVRLKTEFVREMANDLAAASVTDPSNLIILDNLASLYKYLGDQKRLSLALTIAKEIRAHKDN
jgi:hypothetical protein